MLELTPQSPVVAPVEAEQFVLQAFGVPEQLIRRSFISVPKSATLEVSDFANVKALVP